MDIEAEKEKIMSFVTRGNYHAAINLSISGLNECRRNNDQACADDFLRIINDISITMVREFGSQDCLDEITK